LVTVTIVGSQGRTSFGPFRTINNRKTRNNNLFESGQTNGIQFQGQDVGQLQEIMIQRDNTNPGSSDWQIEFIDVSKTDSRGAKTFASSSRRIWLLDTNPKSLRLQ